MNWKIKMIFETLAITMPTEKEVEFVTNVMDGGKTDNIDRANNICAFVNEQGKEKLVYEKLCVLSAIRS